MHNDCKTIDARKPTKINILYKNIQESLRNISSFSEENTKHTHRCIINNIHIRTLLFKQNIFVNMLPKTQKVKTKQKKKQPAKQKIIIVIM